MLITDAWRGGEFGERSSNNGGWCLFFGRFRLTQHTAHHSKSRSNRVDSFKIISSCTRKYSICDNHSWGVRHLVCTMVISALFYWLPLGKAVQWREYTKVLHSRFLQETFISRFKCFGMSYLMCGAEASCLYAISTTCTPLVQNTIDHIPPARGWNVNK